MTANEVLAATADRVEAWLAYKVGGPCGGRHVRRGGAEGRGTTVAVWVPDAGTAGWGGRRVGPEDGAMTEIRTTVLAELARASIDLGMYDMPTPCCREVPTDADVDAAARRISRRRSEATRGPLVQPACGGSGCRFGGAVGRDRAGCPDCAWCPTWQDLINIDGAVCLLNRHPTARPRHVKATRTG